MKNKQPYSSAQSDRLITFREVNTLIGSSAKNGVAARKLAANGKIRSVTINKRVVRYGYLSVIKLISGK